MNHEATYWLETLQKEFNHESDRAAVILSVALLENSLQNLLLAHFIPMPSSNDALFDGPNAPLSNFDAKINLAYRLGVITNQFCRDLHILRKIRNEFAHNIHGCNFNDSKVKNRVHSLLQSSKFIKEQKNLLGISKNTREHFLEILSWMIWHLQTLTTEITKCIEPKKEFGYFSPPDVEKSPSDVSISE